MQPQGESVHLSSYSSHGNIELDGSRKTSCQRSGRTAGNDQQMPPALSVSRSGEAAALSGDLCSITSALPDSFSLCLGAAPSEQKRRDRQGCSLPVPLRK